MGYVDRYYPGMEMDEDEIEDFGGGGLAPFSISEILEHCIEPTLTDGLKHMGKIIAWCFVFRMASQTTKVVPWLGHAASVVSGTVLACHFFRWGSVLHLGFSNARLHHVGCQQQSEGPGQRCPGP